MHKYVVLVLMLFMLLLAGCASAPTTNGVDTTPGEAQQLPEEAQVAIERSREALAEQLGIPQEEIELDSITELDPVEGGYTVVLEVGDGSYTFHYREGEALQVSDPLPLAPTTEPDTESPEGDVQSILIDETGAANVVQDPYTVQEVALEGDVLNATVSYSGGCEEHTFTLVWSGGFEESDPVQTPLALAHDAHGDNCEAFITETLQFDLSPLREVWQERYDGGAGTVVLHVEGLADPVRYDF